MNGKRDKHNRALDMYRRYKALLKRARLVHGPFTSSVLIEFKVARDAEMLHQLLRDTKEEILAEVFAESREKEGGHG